MPIPIRIRISQPYLRRVRIGVVMIFVGIALWLVISFFGDKLPRCGTLICDSLVLILLVLGLILWTGGLIVVMGSLVLMARREAARSNLPKPLPRSKT